MKTIWILTQVKSHLNSHTEDRFYYEKERNAIRQIKELFASYKIDFTDDDLSDLYSNSGLIVHVPRMPHFENVLYKLTEKKLEDEEE